MNRRVTDVLPSQQIHSQDTFNSLRPLTLLLNLFAINGNVIKNKSCSKFIYIFRCLIAFSLLGLVTIFNLLYKILHFYKDTPIAPSIMLTDTVQMAFDLFQYFVDLWFAYKYGRQFSLEYFKQYDHIDSILGITYYSKMNWELIRLLSIFTFIWFSTSVCDYVAWLFSFGWITPTAYMVAYVFLYIKILTTLDLSSHIMHIRFRLITIGDIVEEHYSVTDTLPGFTGSYLSNKIRVYGRVNGSSRSMETNLVNIKRLKCNDESKQLNLLTRCYLQLTEQVEFINCMFGFRILLNSLSLMIDMIRFTNIAVRIVLGTQKISNESRYYPAVSSMMRQVTCILVLINLVTQAEKAYRQRDRVINTIDHLFIDKNLSDTLRVALTKLRSLMLARPINFNLVHFFRLDNSLLVSIASVVVTYTIILLQSMN